MSKERWPDPRTFAIILAGAGSAIAATVIGPAAAQSSPPAQSPPAVPSVAPVSVTYSYSPYERQTIRQAVDALGAEIEPEPEGRTIEAIEFVRLPVFEPRDPLPEFLNVFHWTSRPNTISREVLVKVGQPWRKVLVDETARNLRLLSDQLSMVLTVALKGARPGSVRLLVITKDVWSLRLNWGLTVRTGGLESLSLQPSEQNVFGTHHIASALFQFYPSSYTVGGGYSVPWTFGTRIAAAASAGAYVNRERGDTEGSYGSVRIGQPLWSTRTDWAWGVGGSWNDGMARVYREGRLAGWRDLHSPANAIVPYEYRSRETALSAGVLRSFGWARKVDVTLSAEFADSAYRTPDRSDVDPQALADFAAAVVPRSDTRVGPAVQVRFYTTDFLRIRDAEILGLQEDYRLGPDIVGRVYPVLRAVGASRDYLGGSFAARYVQRLGDGYAAATTEAHIEASDERVYDDSLIASARVVSPRLGFGRLVFDAVGVRRFHNYLNRTTAVGGDVRPRGYPTRALVGRNALAWTLEWRSRPIEILQTQWALVGFFDSGAAWSAPEEATPIHSVGGGIRAGFPQFDRLVFRLDVGAPILPFGAPAGMDPVRPIDFVFAVGQAFGVPSILDIDARTRLPILRP